MAAETYIPPGNSRSGNRQEGALPDRAKAFRYDAFISYSRKDRAFAARLENSLRSYRPPKDLPVPQRFLRVFRDEADLTGVEYHASIENHLKDSAKLLVLCSPDARRSLYVNDEIKRFAGANGAEHIIPVLLSGIPNNEAAADQEAERAFPEELCGLQRIPLATSDYRRFTGAGKEKINKGLFEGSWYALLANLYGLERGEIEQREKKRQARTRRIAVGTAGAIIAILLVALVYALLSRQEALRQREIAQQKQKEAEIQKDRAEKAAEAERRAREEERQQRQLADERRRLAESRQVAANAMARLPADPEVSVLLAIESAKISPTAEAEDALRKSLPELYVQKVYRAHEYPVTGAKFSPDGRVLVTVDGFGYVGFWDVRSGKQKSIRRGHKLPVWKIAFSADGLLAATASWDRSVRVWDSERGKEVATLEGHSDHVLDAAFSPDGRLIITASRDKSVRIWELAPEPKAVGVLSLDDPVVSAGFSRDGSWIFAAFGDDSVRLWEARSLKPMHTVYSALTLPILSRDGRLLIIPRAHHPAVVWDLADSRLRPESGREFSRLLIAALEDRSRFVVTHQENVAAVWDTISGKKVRELRGHGDRITHAQFSPDGSWLVTASADRTARLWSTNRWEAVAILRGHVDGLQDAQFAPNGKTIVTAGDKTARVWKVDGDRAVIEFGSLQRDIRAVSVSPRGDIAVTAGIDNAVAFWIVKTGEPLPVQCRHDKLVIGAEFSPDQKYVVTASFDRVARVWTWTPFSCSIAAQLPGHGGEIADATFSPDQRYVATASGDHVGRIWDWRKRRMLHELRGHGKIVASVAYNPDGSRVVTASADGSARIWDAQSGAAVTVLKLHKGPVRRARFSRDGHLIATASADHSVGIWRARDGTLLAELDEHRGAVGDVAFTSDGKFLVTASDDGKVRLWDASNWTVVGHFVPKAAPAASLALARGNRALLLAENDRRVRIYPWERIAPLSGLLEIAQSRLKRRLSPEEKDLFLPPAQP